MKEWKIYEKGKNKSKKQKMQQMQQYSQVELTASASSSAYHCPVESGEEDGKTWMDSSPLFEVGNITVVTEPDTPTMPLSKKTKRETAVSAMASKSESNVDILAAICELSVMCDATFQKISTIEKTTQATSKEIRIDLSYSSQHDEFEMRFGILPGRASIFGISI